LSSPLAFAAGTTQLQLDPASSQVKWEGRKKIVDSKHFGTIGVKEGSFTLKNGELTAGTVVIDMNSIQNEDVEDEGYRAKLVGHLKSEDFFEVEKFPTATFQLTRVKALKAGKGGATHELSGDLTLKGKTQPVTLQARVEKTGKGMEGTADLTLDRTRWDVRYGSDKFFKSLGDKVIHDEIKLQLKLVAAAK
jgi:polyisoprenoid-binding protein YceI